jgi:hypothetical protein
VWPSVAQGGRGRAQDVPEVAERKVSEAERDAPQQRADPFPFATPRIPKSVGPRADAYTPSPPPSARRVPHQEHASYPMPGKPNWQLSRLDLSTYDTDALNAIEAVANSAPYLGNEVLRNDLILDTELRSSNISL